MVSLGPSDPVGFIPWHGGTGKPGNAPIGGGDPMDEKCKKFIGAGAERLWDPDYWVCKRLGRLDNRYDPPPPPEKIPEKPVPVETGEPYRKNDPVQHQSSACTSERCYPCLLEGTYNNHQRLKCKIPADKEKKVFNKGCPSGYVYQDANSVQFINGDMITTCVKPDAPSPNPTPPSGKQPDPTPPSNKPDPTPNPNKKKDPKNPPIPDPGPGRKPDPRKPDQPEPVLDPLCPPDFGDCPNSKPHKDPQLHSPTDAFELELTELGYTQNALYAGGAGILLTGATYPSKIRYSVAGALFLPPIIQGTSNYMFEHNINSVTVPVYLENMEIRFKNLWNQFVYQTWTLPEYKVERALKTSAGPMVAIGGTVATLLTTGILYHNRALPENLLTYSAVGGVAVSLVAGLAIGGYQWLDDSL